MCQKVDDKKGRFFGGGLRRFDKANPIGLTAWMGFAVSLLAYVRRAIGEGVARHGSFRLNDSRLHCACIANG